MLRAHKHARTGIAWLAVLAAAFSLLAGPLSAPAPAASTASLKKQLDEATGRLAAAEERDAQVGDELIRLNRELAKAEKVLKQVQVRLANRTRLMYTAGIGGDSFEVMLSSSDPTKVIERLSLLESATRDDEAAFAVARGTRRMVEGTRVRVAAARKEADLALAAVARESAQIRKLLGLAADADAAARRRSRASRDAITPRFSGNYACMVGSVHSYRDTWGANRSGGRRHKGVDIFAPMGSPAFAVTNGRISRTGSGGLGGLSVYLRGDDGNEYYYAHMQSIIVRSGRVRAGQLIARVGNTGNARGGSPHIHFELHPGGGRPINPTPFTNRVC